jgi:hypothetical protein
MFQAKAVANKIMGNAHLPFSFCITTSLIKTVF